MATENPLRLPPYKETANFAPSTPKIVVEDMGFLWNDQRFYDSGREVGPNRSGSAPPNMEGSFLAINNLISHQKYGLNLGANENFQVNESERQVQLDSCGSSIDVDRRFPTPPIPRENWHFGRRIGRYGSNWGSTSTYDDNRTYLQPLTTHKEEFEDDLSTKHTSDNSVARTDGLWSGDGRIPLLGQSKSLVELIQEDFPRTPSPVYNHSHYLSSGATDEAADHDTDSTSCHDLSVSTDEAVVLSLDTDTTPLPVSANPEAGPVSSSLSINCTGISQSPSFSHQGNLRSAEVSIQSQLKNLNIYGIPITKEPKSKEQGQYNYQSSMPQQLMHQHQNNSFEVRNSNSQMHPQVSNSTYIGMDQFLHGPSKFSAEAQPVLQSSGFTSPVYPPVAGYMTSLSPYTANLQAPGLYSPPYGVGAYALNSNVAPPFVAGYPPHGAIPVIFDGHNDPNLNARMPVASGRGNVGHGFDMQHFNKFYEQLGYAMQPSFMDPVYMQYYQQSYGLPYSVSGQLDPLASGTGVIRGQNFFADSKKESEVPVGFNDLKLQYQRGGVSNMNQSRVGMMNPPYFGNPLNVGMPMHHSSSLASPVLPGSPMVSSNVSGGRAEVRFSPSAGRYGAVYSGWSSEREPESFNNPKIYNFLEELKSGKGRRFELADIAGHIVEFSSDQHGSRFIQQKLETCSAEEKSSVFGEVLPCASKLITDVFGNYVIQKFFEYGSPEQRKELASQLSGQILPLSLQMYGCRVIQKALEVIDLDQKAQLVSELDGHVTRCVHDQNGNHVIQKCIESIPTEKIQFIISAFRGDVAMLSMHPYGCRVIQRVLEHCTDELQCQFIVDEILESVCVLAKNQYGNYVTQHVLERGKSHERLKIISKLSGHIVQLSQHKFASNVVEKCLVYGTAAERELIIGEILGQDEGNDNLLIMMKDQFANYVVQKILDICTDTQRARLFNRIKIHVHALKKYTYGKHIVARFEQQFGEDNQAS